MSDSFRIQVNEIDRSRTVVTNVGSVGASVIRAPKGPEVPVYIQAGKEQRILDIFGTPSAAYPDIWEAIQYNQDYPIWLSAPQGTGALYGGVVVTTTGSFPLTKGVADPATFNFASIANKQLIGVGDGVDTTHGTTITFFPPNYIAQSIGLIINHNGTDEVVALAPTAAEPEVLSGTITGGAAGTVSGTFTKATGVLALTFTAAPLATDTLYVTYNTNLSSLAYFALFAASPRTDDQGVQVTYDTATGLFSIALTMKNYRGVYKSVDTYKVSLTPNTYDGFGENVYIGNVFEDNDYLIAVDSSKAYASFTPDASVKYLAGGARGAALTITELDAGWDYFKKKTTYPADIFMDFTAVDGVQDTFDTLRSSYQKYKDYILPLPMASDQSAAITVKNGYSINNRGLKFYWNWARVRDAYNNTSFWTSLIGRVGRKYAQMSNVFNGLAPSWIDENNHGGQLGGGIIEMKWDPSEDELQLLDEAGINPIIFHQTYGVMIVSQRTAQSPSTLSDTSWIGHSRLFDYIISQTIDQILTYQITKLNDDIHRQTASSLGQQLIAPILSLNLLRQAIPKCDRSNNTDDVLARREFVFTWGIKVTPFSETIILNFVNVGQTVEVEEVI